MVERWEKPKLIAIVRGKPEEAVLQVCKGGQRVIEPIQGAAACIRGEPDLPCPACMETSAS